MSTAMVRDAQQMREQDYHRTLTLYRDDADDEARTVPAALSTEVEVQRWFGKEKLIHSKSAIMMDRGVDGLPLLFNHNPDQPIGVVRDLKVKDGKLRGVLHFSQNKKATEIWADVRDGFLKDISIGYWLREWKERDDSDLVEVTSWEIFEASVVTIPADPSAGINRSIKEVRTMTEETQTSSQSPDNSGENVADFTQAQQLAKRQGFIEGQRKESERRSGIEALFLSERFQGGEFDVLKRHAIDEGFTVDQTRNQLLDLVGGAAAPIGGVETQSQNRTFSPQGARIQAGEDVLDKFVRGAELALNFRASMLTDDKEIHEARTGEFRSMTLMELARHYLYLKNESVTGMTKEQVAGAAFQRSGMHTTSDFAQILENVANKGMLLGYDEAPETWGRIARRGSLSDFRASKRIGLTSFEDLELVNEKGEYKYGTLGELGEQIQLATYGKIFSITRQTIINDDLDVLSRIPRKMGRAASRMIGDLVWGVLIDNAKLSDNKALFHADHNNLIQDAGKTITIATTDQMRVQMATQQDKVSKRSLNLRLAMLLVPTAMETTANVLRSSQYDPDDTGNTRAPNPFQNAFGVVSDVRLQDADPLSWYASSDPNMTDTIEVAFLDGNDQPFLDSKDGWNSDGVEYKVRIDAAAAAMGEKGLIKFDSN